jgi:hypothetical protein
MKRFAVGHCLLAATALALLSVPLADGASSLSLYTLSPWRVVDTRQPNGPTGGPALTNGTTRNFPITNQCGVPSTAKAAVLNITMVNPSADGFITVWQYPLPWPGVSNLNALAGEPAIANGATVPLAGGSLDVSALYGTTVPGATSHLIIDVTGYFQ